MTLKRDIRNQIENLTILLVENSLVVDQNFPSEDVNGIVWDNYANLTFSLKDEDYRTIYAASVANRDFNFQLIDGAFVQLKYFFESDAVVAHVLGYYPSPNVSNFQESPEDFEDTYFGNTPFAEVREKHVVAFPLRFDFSPVHEDINHPRSHASLGSFTDCRIPVTQPLSPNIFVHFILRNFYFNKFKECFTPATFSCKLPLDETISAPEKGLLHFHIQNSM